MEQYLKDFDAFGRPCWDDLYMALAFVACTRSLDPATKHGCFFAAANHRPLSFGYNGPPRNMPEKDVPLERPLKYYYMLHSEENAILNCGSDLEGATAYVTGFPCSRCTRMMIQKGIKKIIWGPVGSVMLNVNDQEVQATTKMLEHQDIEFKQYQGKGFVSVLLYALQYYASKCSDAELLAKLKVLMETA